MTNGKKLLGAGIITFLVASVGTMAVATGSEEHDTYNAVAEEAPVAEQPPLPSDQYVIDVAVAELDNFLAESARQVEIAKTQQVQRATNSPDVEPNYATGDVSRWDQLAQCEAGGNWATNTGNGFGGGLQFMHQRSYSTWLSYGGGEFAPHPWEASREQQIVIAERVLSGSGWRAWPGCSRKFGWL
jgi:hypothetical protein